MRCRTRECKGTAVVKGSCKPCYQRQYMKTYMPVYNRTKGRAKKLFYKYGLTPEAYEKLYASQNGKCACCGDPLLPGMPQVDHCHKTNRVRGLLCKKCNVGIGLFRDSPALLHQAMQYLLLG